MTKSAEYIESQNQQTILGNIYKTPNTIKVTLAIKWRGEARINKKKKREHKGRNSYIREPEEL